MGNILIGRLDMILMQYEDPQRQEAARKTVPVDRLEEKAAVALARVTTPIFNHHVYIV